MDKTQRAKSLNEQLLTIAESVDSMAEAEIAVTEAYLASLKELKGEVDSGLDEMETMPPAPML